MKQILIVFLFFVSLSQSVYSDTCARDSQIVFIEPPSDFSPRFVVSGCYFERGGKILFLLRNENKPQGKSWCIPGGKLQCSETPSQALQREVEEEIGVTLNLDKLVYCREVYIRFPEVDFVLHLFGYHFSEEPPPLQLALEEHTEYQWVPRKDVYNLQLIPGGQECFSYVDEYCDFEESQ